MNMSTLNNKIVTIIQSRTDSKTIPKKIYSDIEGKPMLWHVINRTKKIQANELVVATTKRKIDDEIVKIAKESSIKYFRGKSNDVLDRYYQTAKKFGANIIIRITADCPLIDPIESNKVLKKFLTGNYDYTSNDQKTYPHGIDTECFSFQALKEAWKHAKSKSEREHITLYFWKQPKKFKIGIVKNKKVLGYQRWVVDHKEDLDFVRKVYSKLYKENTIFSMNDVINLGIRNSTIDLKPVTKKDCKFLYQLLAEREPKMYISHSRMPAYQDHVKFVMSHPYAKWYIIYKNKEKVGSIYLSKQNEIGLFIKKNKKNQGIGSNALRMLFELDPRPRYFANINFRNVKSVKFLTKNFFSPLVHTYELKLPLNLRDLKQ